MKKPLRIMSADLSQTTYFTLLQAFLGNVGSSITKEDFNKQEGIVEMSTETLVLRLLPHAAAENATEPDSVVVEVDLILLDLDNREVNHDRFLILHQLNAVTRFTTGIIAFITQEGMLSVSKIILIDGLDEKNFSEEVAKVLQAANALYEGWNDLAELVEENCIQEQENDASKITITQKA